MQILNFAEAAPTLLYIKKYKISLQFNADSLCLSALFFQSQLISCEVRPW
jgi:hypothetical protein